MHFGTQSIRGLLAGCFRKQVADGNLAMRILALGGDHSFGAQLADIMRLVATDVTDGAIAKSGVMEEQPRNGRPQPLSILFEK